MSFFPTRMFVFFVFIIWLSVFFIARYQNLSVSSIKDSTNNISELMDYYPEADSEYATIFDLWDKIVYKYNSVISDIYVAKDFVIRKYIWLTICSYVFYTRAYYFIKINTNLI